MFYRDGQEISIGSLENNIVEMQSRNFYPVSRAQSRAYYAPWMGLHMLESPNIRFMHHAKFGPYLKCVLR